MNDVPQKSLTGEKDEGCSLFTKSSECADLVLLVEEKKIFVNRNLLMIASPVFNVMLSSDFKEKDSSEIPLPRKKYNDVVAFLRCLYPDLMDPIGSTNVNKVLPLADEYQCSRLKQRCDDYLKENLSKDQSIRNAVKCTVTAERYGLHEFLTDCIEVLSNKELPLVKRQWESISSEVKVQISTKRIEKLEAFCKGALTHVRNEYKSVKNFLRSGTETKQVPLKYEDYRETLTEFFRANMDIFQQT